MIILDASALTEFLCQSAKHPQVSKRLASEKQVLAPSLIDLEVTNSLRRQCAKKALTIERAEEALSDLRDFPMRRYAHGPLLGRVWELRHRFTAYDASYIALAELLEVPLVTCDSKLAEAGSIVEVIE